MYSSSGSSLGHHAPVEDISRRSSSQTPADFYLWNLKQLSLAGGLVIPSSSVSGGSSSNSNGGGGDIAWATVMRDVEIARRSSIILTSTGLGAGGDTSGNGASLPTKLPMQSVAGFPLLQDFGANPSRLPLPQQQQQQSFFQSSSSSSLIVQPEFIFANIHHHESPTTTASSTFSSPSSSSSSNAFVPSCRWEQLTKMPENPYPAQPDTAPSQLNDVAGPPRLRPPQRFVLDKTTAARIEREKAEVKRRTRRELLQSLATEAAVGSFDMPSSPAETVKMLETLPEFLLRLTKSAIVAQTTLMQTELEESLTSTAPSSTTTITSTTTMMNSNHHNNKHGLLIPSSKYAGGFRVPTTSWLMENLTKGK